MEDRRSQVPEALAWMAPKPAKFSFDPSKPYIIHGRNGLTIRIRPGALDLPSACEKPGSMVDAYLTDYISPLEVVAAGVDFLPQSAQIYEQASAPTDASLFRTQPPIILESAGMFELSIHCKGSPVQVADGKRIDLQKPNTIPGNEFGMYRRTPSGWQESPLRKPASDSVVLRGRADLEAGGSDPIYILDYNQHYELESYPSGPFSIRATPGQKKEVWFVSPRHFPASAEYDVPGNPGVMNVESELLKPFPRAVDEDSIMEGSSRQSPLPVSSVCRAWVRVYHYDTGRPSFGLKMKIGDREEEFSREDYSFCLRQSELELEKGVTVEFDFGAGYEEQKKITYRFDKSHDGKWISLVTNRKVNQGYGESADPEAIVVSGDSDDSKSGFSTYVFLNSTGFWNFDFPRTDLACLNVEMSGYQGPFFASVISLDRFSAYSLPGQEGGLKMAFLQGERSKVLVFSTRGEAMYGVSDSFDVWRKYGHFKLPDSPCQDVGPIEMKPLPEYARKDPDRFKEELGLR